MHRKPKKYPLYAISAVYSSQMDGVQVRAAVHGDLCPAAQRLLSAAASLQSKTLPHFHLPAPPKPLVKSAVDGVKVRHPSVTGQRRHVTNPFEQAASAADACAAYAPNGFLHCVFVTL